MAYYPDIQTLADVPRLHARLRGDKVALIEGDRKITYAELDHAATACAAALEAEGVKAGGRVGVLDKNAADYFALLFGTAKIGAVLVPVNWRLAAPEITFILNDAEAEVLFVGPDFVEALRYFGTELKTVRKIVVMGPAAGDWPGFADFLAPFDTAADPRRETGPKGTVLQMYTSGTTGHPKGVMLTHYNFLGNVPLREESAEAWATWSAEDVGQVAMPLFHIGGTGSAFLGIYAGATMVITRDFDPGLVLRQIEEYRIAKVFYVPAVLLFLLQHPAAATTDFSSLQYILYGASPIPLDLLRKALAVFKCGFVQLYGMTENCGLCTYLPAEDHDPAGNERMRSAGKPQVGVEVKVIDADGNALPPRQVGEICARSRATMAGYWKRDDATAKTIDADGWLHTGDAGYLDEDGYVYIYDRVKDMIVSGGENIYPAEIESALFGHPDVADVAVIGVPDDKWGEAVKAVVVPKPDSRPDADEIIAFARTRIAGYKVPRSVDFVEYLPRNASGKLLKRELREPYWVGRERRVN
ncbi:fatty acid--CoA ligase [Zavarzinia compransoris]|uniref:3-methylmercaptopropionyl-CoA ligase n=1 Tax=Zavarzinia compransoris TaxID=1264899 RepID=A0A317E5V7_9PROT|nr:fatty acid--CoA ligase [Zavarzinia compransoris]PWR22051.1 acyl-CoA synthetase [Zavarzinia compransoris]TDP47208.1 long-chain acyl-CoA synthetase [Zavarzinia compransoris]